MNSPRGVQVGRYRLEKRLAGGGMAEVYLARFRGAAGFERDVVLKRIRPGLAQSEEFVRMLLDEARIAATLHHPNIVQAFDVEEEEGEYYIAMEYLDGLDLRHIQAILDERDELMPLENAVHICAGLAAGLDHAHAKTDAEGQPLRIVHRDVSPHNVLLTREGGVKLVDFGIAKAENRQTETLHGGLKGKLSYMSPEQVRGEAIDHRSDLFSLGIILYELTTGTYLFTGRTEYALLNDIAEVAIEPPSRIADDYPRELEWIVMQALTKTPEKRYASAGALQADLEAFARDYALSLSTLSLSQLVGELADAPSPATEAGESLTPWVANLAVKAGAELSLDEALDSLGGEDGGEGQRRPGAEQGATLYVPRSPGVGAAGPAAGGATDAVAGGEIDPSAELRSGRRVLWLAALLVGAAALALGAWLSRARQEAEPEPPQAPAAPPAGAIELSGAPAGAGVWLHLGRTPAESPPLSSQSPHQLRLELEDHAPRDVSVLPSRWAERRGEIGVWLDVELERRTGGPGRAAHRVPERPEDDSFQPTVRGEGSMYVESQPEGAQVWLFVGLLPDATLGDVRADRGYRVRVAKPGFAAEELDVDPEAFELSQGGRRARFEVELESAR